MNTAETKKFIESKKIVALKADKTGKAPEVDALLRDLGNPSGAIPYLAIYPKDGSKPIILRNLITQSQVIEALKEADSRGSATPAATAMNTPRSK